jgi:hypothetical protein
MSLEAQQHCGGEDISVQGSRVQPFIGSGSPVQEFWRSGGQWFKVRGQEFGLNL